MSIITALSWVPRGKAAQFPTRYEFDEEEYNRISKIAKLELEDAKEELEEAQGKAEDGARVNGDDKTNGHTNGDAVGKKSKVNKDRDDEDSDMCVT